MKYKYNIGDWVRVKNTIYLYYDDKDNRVIGKEDIDVIGQVCGARKRKLGKYHGSSLNHFSPHLEVKEVITVWLVRIGMLNKPIEVLDEDLDWLDKGEEINYILNKELPWLWIDENIRKQQSKVMKEEAKHFVRDKNGRFTGEYKNPFNNEQGN